MKKSIRNIAVAVLASSFLLAGCNNNGGAKHLKIGVLVADVSGEEALSFRDYYENYVAKHFDVEFEYTTQLEDAASEKSAIEDFAARGFDAVISMASADRATQLSTCVANNIYYAVASGMLDEAVFNQYKTNKYFLGEIGPSMTTEYEAGLAMGQYYKEQGVTKVGLYGAFIPNPMHVYRAAGVLKGLGLTYGGTDDVGAVVGGIFTDNGINASKIAGDVAVEYLAGFDPSTIYGTLAQVVGSGIDAFLSVGMATTFFAANLDEAHVSYSDIDSFTTANGGHMKDGSLTYLAGKYASSIGPVYALIANATSGHAVRDEEGNAPSISQGYAVAKSGEEFTALSTRDSGENRIFSEEVLKGMIGAEVTYTSFVTACNK